MKSRLFALPLHAAVIRRRAQCTLIPRTFRERAQDDTDLEALIYDDWSSGTQGPHSSKRLANTNLVPRDCVTKGAGYKQVQEQSE